MVTVRIAAPSTVSVGLDYHFCFDTYVRSESEESNFLRSIMHCKI